MPVDGHVVHGHSFVDQSAITGESVPVEKEIGSQVFAGTMNQVGAIEVRAERLGQDSTFGKIIQAVERAESSRAPIQRVADRLAVIGMCSLCWRSRLGELICANAAARACTCRAFSVPAISPARLTW